MKQTGQTLYRSFDVWKRLSSKKLIRYRCFQVMPQNKFCVQNADIYEFPLKVGEEREFERNFIEQLFERPPEVRNRVFATIEEAIFEYDVEYETLWED